MHKLIPRPLALFVLLAASAPLALAQRMGAAPHMAAPAPHASAVHGSSAANTPAPPGFEGIHNRFLSGRRGRELSRFRNVSPYEPGYFPLLTDWFGPEDLYAAGYPVASQLPYNVEVYQGRAPSASDRQPLPPQESLLIELQGDHYVRVKENQAGADTNAQLVNQGPPAITSTSPVAPLPSVVLIFRDGSRQEVRDYTIADGVLYARGDLYTDGYWNKKIELASLNVEETVSANRTRGVHFILPSAPNEVITRP
jgi:hypothetical protein